MKRALTLLTVLSLAACQPQPKLPTVEYPEDPLLKSLATPVQLDAQGYALLNSFDYIPSGADSITIPSGWELSLPDTLGFFGILASRSADVQSVVTIHKGEQSFDIIVHRSRKRPLDVRIPASWLDEPVTVFGSFNAWNRIADTLVRDGENLVYEGLFQPGVIEYKFYHNGTEYTDPNADSVSNGMGGFNSVRTVELGSEAPIQFYSSGFDGKKVKFSAIPAEQEILAFWENRLLPSAYITRTDSSFSVAIPEVAQSIDRSTLRIFSHNKGAWTKEVQVPLAMGSPITDASLINRDDWRSARMYFMMVDRFANGDTANDRPLNDPEVLPQADFMGGDVAGIIQKLRSGYFDSLGVNTIWLSPIARNAEGAWGLWDKGGVRTKFSAYHGYWPTSNTLLDHRFGTAEEVQTLLDEAHAKGYNVVLDYVANHVHQNHPVYQEHPEWATNLYLPDGTLNTEKWDEHRLTTWFDNHLPTLDLRKPEVVEPMTDSALVWVTDFNFDGFRHDATKHIDLLYWRTLTSKVKRNVDRPIYQIGETYGSAELISSYLSTGMLNAQFDFNAYDAIVGVLADSAVDVDRVVDVMNASWEWYGQHNTMGYISGNQDRSRFISLASGDVRLDEDQKLAGYTRDIGKPSMEGYKKLELLHVFNHSIPGIPVIYYGDEYGSPGANDPDNRRMMEFEGLDEDEAALREAVTALQNLRSSEMAMVYGTAEIESIGDQVIHIKRRYLGTTIDIYINRGDSETNVPEGEDAEVLYGASGSVLPGLSATIRKTTTL